MHSGQFAWMMLLLTALLCMPKMASAQELVEGHSVLGMPLLSPVDDGDSTPIETQADTTSLQKKPIGIQDVFPMFSGDSSLDGIEPISDELQSYGILAFVDYDSFRGVPDGSWSNYGIRTGFNAATKLGQFSEMTGIGLQVGASVGAYDWGGTEYRLQNQNQAETQSFLTYGLYRKPTESSRLSGGIVQDWSFNANYGVFAQSPALSQLRAQVGYATSASNEFGVSGTAHLHDSIRNIPGYGPTTWQSINQVSGYWHHKWYAGGPDTWVSVGRPAYDRLSGGGSVGDYLVSATASCPLSDVVSVTSSVTYMHQSAAIGPTGSNDEAWNLIVGIVIYPGRNSRSSTVAGQRWMPLLPVANNGNFLVDTNNSY